MALLLTAEILTSGNIVSLPIPGVGGGTRTISSDARVIAATNRDLAEDVAVGRFRADLFYRLNVFPITMPPSRRRREDIPLLVKHFVSVFSNKGKKLIDQVSHPVMDALTAYDWPGNVRETMAGAFKTLAKAVTTVI